MTGCQLQTPLAIYGIYLVYCDRVGGGGGAVKCQDIHDPSTVDAQTSTGTEQTHVSKEEGATSHDGGGLDKRKVS